MTPIIISHSVDCRVDLFSFIDDFLNCTKIVIDRNVLNLERELSSSIIVKFYQRILAIVVIGIRFSSSCFFCDSIVVLVFRKWEIAGIYSNSVHSC